MAQRILIVCAGLVLAGAAIFAAAPQDKTLEAARQNNLGAAYMNQQLFEKGLKAFQNAAALDPKSSVAQVNQGIAQLNLGHVDEARQILESASKSNPQDPHVWYNLGLLYKNSSDSQLAVDAFRRVTEIDPNDADTWYFLGTAYSQLKQFPQAIEAFQYALKLNPLHASAQFGISRAYQQSGEVPTAREHLQRFQYITQNKLGSAITLAYGEQGQYSRVEESPAVVEKVPEAIAVKFVDVTSESGLIGKPVPATGNYSPASLGPGACFLDYDGDGKLDLFLSDNGSQGGMTMYRNLSNGKFEDVSKKAGIDPSQHGIGCTTGDYDNDGAVDVAVTFADRILLLRNEKNETLKDVTDNAGIKSDDINLGITFVDYDHDGDLDLYVARSSDRPMSGRITGLNTMWRNNGNGEFTDVTEATGLRGFAPAINSIGTDSNNDRAVDIVVTGATLMLNGGKPVGPEATALFENPREGRFNARQPWLGLGGGTVGVTVLDFDHDGWMDLAFTHPMSPGLTLWRNKLGNFEQVALPKTDWTRGFGVTALDYDNDGWIDLVAVGETRDGKGEVRLFRNLGPDGFKDVTSEVGLDKITFKDPRAIIIGDYNGDGATDLLITQNHGPAVLLRNEGGNKNNWLKLDLKGLADNKSAIGTKIEIFSGANRQKFEIAGSSGYLGQNSLQLTIGLGQAKEADVVRMLWPTGVLQDEIQVEGGKVHSYTEMDRRGSSCPTLFVWNGDHYELVADMLGAGVIGHWVAPGEHNIARPTEYVKIDRNMIREKNPHPVAKDATRVGHPTLSFRLMEPMEEVVYLDQVGLVAVDHPSNFDVYPNEYFASNPPYPPFKVVATRNAQPPTGVWDDHGHNLLPDLLANKYVGDFELAPFKGFTKLHSLELDLGRPYAGGPLWLLMHGEIEYFTATGMYAADQAGIKAIAPYVEAQNAKGKWVQVIDDMGFPAGGPRTMTADLTGKLPQGTHRIRIWTNLQIYWDSILVDRTPQKQNVRLTRVPLQTADLGFHGYPRQIESQPPGVVKYKYEEVSRTGPYARQAGTYTRYGDVQPLLSSFDDRLAVFGSGEQVALEFDPSALPPLPQGWTRDYFFLANGYEKDMDFYAAHGDTVEPLPFRSMGTYPYPKHKAFPLDDAHMDYMLKYNTRHVSGNEPQGYWFNYEEKK